MAFHEEGSGQRVGQRGRSVAGGRADTHNGPMTRSRALLGVLAVVALGLALAGIVARIQPREYNTRLDSYSCVGGDDRFLRIATGVGPGDHVVSAVAHDDPDKVTIAVVAVDPEPPDVPQQLSLTLTTVEVVLRDRLGNRPVVDQNGQRIQGKCP